MSLLKYVPLTAYFLIAVALPENGDLCLQSREQDTLLFRSFQYIQTWFYSVLDEESQATTMKIQSVETNLDETNQELEKIRDLIANLNSRLDAMAESKEVETSIKTWVNNKFAEENEKAVDRFKKLEATVGENKESLEEFTQRHQELDETLKSMEKSIGELEIGVRKTEETDQRLDALQEEAKEKSEKLQKLIESYDSTIENIENSQSDCITDIKLSLVEQSKLWMGLGFEEAGNQGYVMTGVNNVNEDAFPDSVFRRKIMFKIKDEWLPVHD